MLSIIESRARKKGMNYHFTMARALALECIVYTTSKKGAYTPKPLTKKQKKLRGKAKRAKQARKKNRGSQKLKITIQSNVRKQIRNCYPE